MNPGAVNPAHRGREGVEGKADGEDRLGEHDGHDEKDSEEDDIRERSVAAQVAINEMVVSKSADHGEGTEEEDEGHGQAGRACDPLIGEFGDVGLVEENEGGDAAGGPRGGETSKGHMVLDVPGGRFRVEARQPESGAADVERGDDPEQAAKSVVMVGTDDGGGGRVGQVIQTDEADGEVCGRDPEGDDIGEGIELGANVGRRASQPCDGAVNGVKEHADKNEQSGHGKGGPIAEPDAGRVEGLGGVVNGGEAADEVSKRHHRGENCDGAGTTMAKTAVGAFTERGSGVRPRGAGVGFVADGGRAIKREVIRLA